MNETSAAPNRFYRVLDFIPHWLAKKTLRMAMVMAVVAIFGAVTAFQAGKAELDASLHERMLQHGQLLELKYWQEYLYDLSQYNKYWATSDLHYQESYNRRLNAEDLRRNHDLAGAALQDLYSQQRSAMGKSQIPFYKNFPNFGLQYEDTKAFPAGQNTAGYCEHPRGLRLRNQRPTAMLG